ncbi:hypothetical protein C1H46_043460 [Malus baccata]|uniref:Uncharacterized protein n=1 Tax=Malus baccata TaxID=106549 RepID=A0A540K9W2_MALBA|nr:hypothetical protein C1H46_043460 [Malus baccata]
MGHGVSQTLFVGDGIGQGGSPYVCCLKSHTKIGCNLQCGGIDERVGGDRGEEVNIVFGVEAANVDGVSGRRAIDLHPPPMLVDLHPKGDDRRCILA